MLVIDDAGPDRRPVSILDDIAESIHHSVVLYHRQENGGFTRACNDAFAATAGRDVIIVNSDVVVGAEWLSRLSDAANSSPSIATASTLTNHGTMVSVPDRNRPSDRLPPGITADEAARRIAANSLRLRPTVPTAIGHCMYIKRGGTRRRRRLRRVVRDGVRRGTGLLPACSRAGLQARLCRRRLHVPSRCIVVR